MDQEDNKEETPEEKPAAPQEPQQTNNNNTGGVDQRWLVTLLLCWFLGVFGVHRFYTGHTVIGIVQLLTAGGCGIWTLIDLIMIIVGNYKDADGNPIKNN